jgi:hypothetical protein
MKYAGCCDMVPPILEEVIVKKEQEQVQEVLENLALVESHHLV